jgi:hypothetical protein
MTRRALLNAIEANRAGGTLPGMDPESQGVRSCGVTLAMDIPFEKGARNLLFPNRPAQHAEPVGAAE